jgi:diaminopimelate epimerase
MNLHFTKMHGLGNDFMVLDLVRQPLQLQEAQVREWAQRQTGVGFDQLLVLEPASQPGCDFAYRIFNADGGEVEHCGNGARCITRFVIDKGLSSKRQLTFAMARGSIRCRLEDDGLVTVDMGVPVLEPERIPFTASAQSLLYPLDVDGTLYEINAVSMGNPHAVLLVDDVDHAPVAELGPLVENHPAFPQRVNAGFLQVLDAGTARLRVFERGTGETLACGTGACAAVVGGRLRGLLDASVEVHMRGGLLRIYWPGPGESLWMTGPAVTVFEGQIQTDTGEAGT